MFIRATQQPSTYFTITNVFDFDYTWQTIKLLIIKLIRQIIGQLIKIFSYLIIIITRITMYEITTMTRIGPGRHFYDKKLLNK